MTDPHERWVLFDLDGTLLDYERAEQDAVLAALTGIGITADAATVATYRAVNARHWEALERGETTADELRTARWAEVLQELSPGQQGGVDLARLAADYIAALARGAHLVPDAVEVVDTIAATHRIAFITNGLADVQRPRLAATPLLERAEVVVISDEVGAAKPDAAIFDAAFQAMGDPDRGQVTMVGDSLTADVAGGRAYGLRTVWVAPQDAGPPGAADLQPDHRITRLTELPPLLTDLGEARPA